MNKTLLLCDSASDLSFEQEKKLGFRVVNCGVELDGIPYEDRAEVNSEKIYEFVAQTGMMPHTSQITVIQFIEEYLRAVKEGYLNIICVTMNAQGSGTNSAANHAVQVFMKEYPALAGKIKIRVVDSRTYSFAIVLPMLTAAERLKKGENPDKVADWLEEYYKSEITIVGLMGLQYAKKSGRLNACAALVGEVLGIKPIMSITGENKVLEKTRGDKALIARMAKMYMDMAEDPKHGEYIVAYGNNLPQAKELIAEIKKLGGKAPVLIGPIGPCVAINAGPKMLGLGFRCK